MSNEIPHSSWQSAVVAMSRTFIGLVIIIGLSWGKPILIPIALATLLTFLLNPAIRILQRFGMGRLISVAVAVTIVGMVATTLGVIGSRQISSLLAELPANTAKIKAKIRALKAVISGPTATAFEEMIEEVSQEFQSSGKEPAADKTSRESVDNSSSKNLDPVAKPPIIQAIVPSSEHPWMLLTGYLGSAIEVLATFTFTLVLLVFFLLEREGLRDRIVLLAGKTRLTLTSKALEDASSRISRYIVLVATVNGSFGLLLTVGLFCLGVPYAILWGCLAALLRFIPYIGPWVGALFPNYDEPRDVGRLVAADFCVCIRHDIGVGCEQCRRTDRIWANNRDRPRCDAHLGCILDVFVGPVGLVLSAPFAVCLVVIGKNIPQLRFLNILLGDEPAFSANVGLYQRLLVRDQREASILVSSRLSSADSENVYDELLIPALNYARRDVQRGHLSVEDCDSLLLALTDSFLTMKSRVKPAAEDKEKVSGEIEPLRSTKLLTLMGCSADGDIDRTALSMLNEILDPTRWHLECPADGMLTSEIADQVAKEPPCAIVIASLPPDGIAHARYLCKKLRAASPDVLILVGRWGQRKIHPLDRERLLDAGASEVTSSLLETRKWLKSHYPFLEPAQPDRDNADSNRAAEFAEAIPR